MSTNCCLQQQSLRPNAQSNASPPQHATGCHTHKLSASRGPAAKQPSSDTHDHVPPGSFSRSSLRRSLKHRFKGICSLLGPPLDRHIAQPRASTQPRLGRIRLPIRQAHSAFPSAPGLFSRGAVRKCSHKPILAASSLGMGRVVACAVGVAAQVRGVRPAGLHGCGAHLVWELILHGMQNQDRTERLHSSLL